MTKEEAIEVLKTINEMYPKFNLTKRKAMVLLPNLKAMDYDGVMLKLSFHVMDHPYPPTLNEIASYPAEENSALQEVGQWMEEAKEVSPEVKDAFQEQFKQLVQQMKGK